ncbi:SWF or SNF family helicase [Streptomyces lavendulocolor]|uniref:SWF or SNF family helicase n=1 Tax=Streptomyces lavendulocolor TaxID=67316 RepID=A0ABV2WDA4_9ACTN
MSRDEDMERTFAALPPVRGRGFAETWWGRAWLKALEDTALDGEQVKKGRRRARDGAVGAISVRPGRLTAVVQDPDGTAHRSDVLLQVLSDEEWDRFLEMAVDRAGHIAALLDREMPPHLVEDAASAGVDLLPGIGDLEPECACDAWDHCPHTSALCHQVARLLDQDPFVLFLMRGRGERCLLDELQQRSAARAGRAERDDERDEEVPEPGVTVGVRADEVFAARDLVAPLPAPPPLPEAPGEPPSYDTGTRPAQGVDPAALEALAADAAARAYRMLVDALAAGHENRPLEAPLTVEQDAIRLAASGGFGPAALDRIATATGRGHAGLDVATRAWRWGGAEGLAVLDEDGAAGAEVPAGAEARLAAAWEDDERPALRADRPGCWTVLGTGLQLRSDRLGRWWPYREESGRWAPAGPPSPDPAAALASTSADDA